jgi:hypothetical protein
MKRFWLFLLLTIPIIAQAQDTTLVFAGPKLRLNTFALLPPSPIITWQLSKTVTDTPIQATACITNVSSADDIRFFINGEEQPPERKNSGNETNPCPNGYFFNRTIELTTTESTLRLEARNTGGADMAYFMVKYIKP